MFNAAPTVYHIASRVHGVKAIQFFAKTISSVENGRTKLVNLELASHSWPFQEP